MRPSDLRGILSYTSRFRDKTFVLNIDSEVIAHPNFRNLMLDISVLRSLNIDIVVVHGASWQIKEIGKELKIEPSNSDGMGVTDEKTLKLSILASNQIAHEILESFSDSDQRATVTNAIIAHPSGILGGNDQAWTGRVERVDTPFLQKLLESGVVPVVPPLGFDGEGRTFRVNSDGVAFEVAKSLNAAKLMFITTSNGVVGAGSLSAQFSVAEGEDFLRKNKPTLPHDLASKLEHGLSACKSGVNRVHIIDGRNEEALLREVFSNEGIGTMIYANEYEAIRRARKKDVRPLLSMIRNSVQAEELVDRDEGEVAARINDFYVFEIDRNIVGSVALHRFEKDPKTAEMGCLFVSNGHENQGIGRKLMHFVDSKARELGVEQLFALSTRAFNYFQQKGGFQEGSAEMLPLERKAKYDQSGRNSKVLYKNLK